LAPEAISPEHVPGAIASRDSDQTFSSGERPADPKGRPGARSCVRFARLGKKRRPAGASQKSRGLCADTWARRARADRRPALKDAGCRKKPPRAGSWPGRPIRGVDRGRKSPGTGLPPRASRRLVAPRPRPAPHGSPTPSARAAHSRVRRTRQDRRGPRSTSRGPAARRQACSGGRPGAGRAATERLIAGGPGGRP